MSVPANIGRPSSYSAEVVGTICTRLVEGQSLREICRDPEMPNASTVFVWLGKYPDFAEQYARAREAQAEALFDDILEICDDSTNDWVDRQTESGETIRVVDHEHINRSKLRVDARKWMASKLAPKKYADKVELQAEVKHLHVVDSSSLTYDQRDQLRDILHAAIEQARDQGSVIEHQSGEE